MSGRVRAQRYAPPPEPPKKRRTGLIIGLIIGAIVLIIIIVVVIILLMRRGGGGGGGGNDGCKTDADCTALAPKCDVDTGTCLKCLVEADCEADEICNTAGLCIAVDCKANTDCSGATPFCVNNDCVQCAEDADCPIETGYCQNGVCKECIADTDCDSGQSCVSNACVCGGNATLTLAPTGIGTGPTFAIGGTWSSSITPTGGTMFIRDPAFPEDFPIIAPTPTITTLFYTHPVIHPTVPYLVSVKATLGCGETPESERKTVTIPDCGAIASPSPVLAGTAGIGGFTVNVSGSPPAVNQNNVRLFCIGSRVPNFHPTWPQIAFPEQPIALYFQQSFFWANASPAPNPPVHVGDVWYLRMWWVSDTGGCTGQLRGPPSLALQVTIQ